MSHNVSHEKASSQLATPERSIVRHWRGLRRWATAHSFAINVSVFSVICFLAVADVYFNGDGEGRHADWFAYVLLVGQTLPLAFRLRYPLGSMYVVCISIGLYWTSTIRSASTVPQW